MAQAPVHASHLSVRYDGDAYEFRVPWQSGPVKEVGINGVQADDVLREVQGYLEAVNVPPYASAFTANAIEAIRLARVSLALRKAERESRGVEGTNQE